MIIFTIVLLILSIVGIFTIGFINTAALLVILFILTLFLAVAARGSA